MVFGFGDSLHTEKAIISRLLRARHVKIRCDKTETVLHPSTPFTPIICPSYFFSSSCSSTKVGWTTHKPFSIPESLPPPPSPSIRLFLLVFQLLGKPRNDDTESVLHPSNSLPSFYLSVLSFFSSSSSLTNKIYNTETAFHPSTVPSPHVKVNQDYNIAETALHLSIPIPLSPVHLLFVLKLFD